MATTEATATVVSCILNTETTAATVAVVRFAVVVRSGRRRCSLMDE